MVGSRSLEMALEKGKAFGKICLAPKLRAWERTLSGDAVRRGQGRAKRCSKPFKPRNSPRDWIADYRRAAAAEGWIEHPTARGRF
jgi:hypothetical protein